MPAYYPASSRIGVYSPNVIQGIVGGIPDRSGGDVIDVTDFGWGDLETAADNSTAFNAALAASAPGDVISIPAGEFSVVTLDIPYTASNRSIRGAGIATTIIKPSSITGVQIYGPTDFGSEFNPSSTITSLAKDSAVITVADGSGFPSPSGESQHRLGRILLQNEIVTPIVSVAGYAETRYFDVVMVSRSGNNITLSQPLPSAFSDGLSGAVFELAFQLERICTGVGLEDMTIDGTESLGAMVNGISFIGNSNCWLKNIKLLGQENYGIKLYDCVNFEIRGCYVSGPGGLEPNHGGILCNTGCYGLIEDNIVVENFPDIEENQGSMSNVWAYNYVGAVFNTNHGPHNSFNLYEGNYVASFFIADGYFGGCSQETYFRNCSFLVPILKRFSRTTNIVGNIIFSDESTGSENWGDPNIGNNSSIGTAEPSDGDWWAAWDVGEGRPYAWTGTLTTRTSDTAGEVTLDTGQAASLDNSLDFSGTRLVSLGIPVLSINAITVGTIVGDLVPLSGASGVLPAEDSEVVLYGGPDGFQEKDLDVENTIELKANYYFFTAEIPSEEALGGDTLADSWFRSSEPAYFSGFNWPPFDSADPAAVYFGNEIPAGQRYFDSLPPAAPVILNDEETTKFLGEEFLLQIITDIPADEYSATDLPVWASLDDETGLITGDPAEGVFEFTLHATNAIGTGDLPMTLTVRATRRAVITPVGGGARYGPTVQGAFIIL